MSFNVLKLKNTLCSYLSEFSGSYLLPGWESENFFVKGSFYFKNNRKGVACQRRSICGCRLSKATGRGRRAQKEGPQNNQVLVWFSYQHSVTTVACNRPIFNA